MVWLQRTTQGTEPVCCCSAAKSCPTLRRLLYPSLSPRVRSNSCPLSRRCHPTISSTVTPYSSLPSIFPSIRVFSNESVLRIRGPKYWNFSFNISISLFSEYSGSISFRIDWFDFLAVQGSLKGLLQCNSLKASVLQHSAFLNDSSHTSMYVYWKNYSFDYIDPVSKVASLLFNTLSRFVTAFLSRNKHLLISWAIVTICSDFGAQENKICLCFHFLPFYMP